MCVLTYRASEPARRLFCGQRASTKTAACLDTQSVVFRLGHPSILDRQRARVVKTVTIRFERLMIPQPPVPAASSRRRVVRGRASGRPRGAPPGSSRPMVGCGTRPATQSIRAPEVVISRVHGLGDAVRVEVEAIPGFEPRRVLGVLGIGEHADSAGQRPPVRSDPRRPGHGSGRDARR